LEKNPYFFQISQNENIVVQMDELEKIGIFLQKLMIFVSAGISSIPAVHEKFT